MFKSTDRGKSFEPLNFPHGDAIEGNNGGGKDAGKRTRGERLEISPFDSNELLFGLLFSETGLWKSVDGGDNWTRVPVAGGGSEVVTIVYYDRYKKGHFYVFLDGKGLFYTTNDGSSFSKANCNATEVQRMAQASDGTIYFCNRSLNTSQGMVFKMKDGNVTDITNGVAQAWSPTRSPRELRRRSTLCTVQSLFPRVNGILRAVPTWVVLCTIRALMNRRPST